MRNSVGKNPFPLIISVIGFLIVFLLNWKINLLYTAIIRGVFTFIVFYSIGTILNLTLISDNAVNVEKGTKIQLVTPADDMNQLMKEFYQTKPDDEHETDSDFKPMEFKKMKINDEENN